MHQCNRGRVSLLITLLLMTAGCTTVPFDYPRDASVAIDESIDTSLRRDVARWAAENEGPSGFYPLIEGRDALGARLRLIKLAEKTIDVQCFLMKGDTAGQVFAASLMQAAERGVRVRLLLDDIFTTVEDDVLYLLDAHPNIELRLFNPVAHRGIGFINYLVHFKRANRRMHNKSFTVDNQVSIVGGRNIADEYFELMPEGEFLDLDVVGIGPVAADVSKVFDGFWNNSRSLPVEAIASRVSTADLDKAGKAVSNTMVASGRQIYDDAVGSDLVRNLFDGRQALYSAAADVMTDHPDKLTEKRVPNDEFLVHKLQQIVAGASQEVIVFTPYFVPGKDGVRFWRSVVDSGVEVTVITNSLASSNHPSVHAGYATYRKRIIEAGVNLYEVRANAVDGGKKFLTLHTKGMIIDRHTVFIGSLNLDPRSTDINSEMGLLISNAALSESLASAALAQLNAIAYRVELDEHRRLRWRATISGVEVVERSEPLASIFRRFEAFLLRIVPENQL
jgi:cardiolipin synthase C